MNADIQARLLAVETMPGSPHTRLVAAVTITVENFMDEIGCPLTSEQLAAFEDVRRSAA